MDIPKHYSLMKEDDKHFHLHDARDNTSFKIAKKDVHPANQLKILKVKKYSGGTDDAENDAPEGYDSGMAFKKEERPPPDAYESQPWYGNYVGSIPGSQNTPPVPDQTPVETGATGSYDQFTPQGSQATGLPANDLGWHSRGPGDNPGFYGHAEDAKPIQPDLLQQYNANSAQERGGVYNAAKAQQNLGEEQAGIYQDSTKAIQSVLENHQQKMASLDAENDALTKTIANSKIDPSRYVHNMGTGQKIMSAIGLMLGGLGSGLTHGPNLAYESLQKNIQNDIEAQKMDLGKKNSLLSMNLQKYGRLDAATQATMMQMNAMTQGQIAQTAAKYGGQINMGNVQATLGKMKNDEMMQGMNLKQMVLQNDMKQHLAQGEVSGQNPLDYVKWVVPGDKQKEVATELGKAQFVRANHDKMMALWDQAQKEQTMARTGFGMVDAPATRALRAMGDPLIHDQEGRVNEFEKKDFEGLMPSSGQLDSRQEELRNSFENFVNAKAQAPLAKTFGLDINRFNSTSPGNSSRPVERITQDGKRALFDPTTKKFLGYKSNGR